MSCNWDWLSSFNKSAHPCVCCMCMYICMYVCMYVCMCVCMCVCGRVCVNCFIVFLFVNCDCMFCCILVHVFTCLDFKYNVSQTVCGCVLSFDTFCLGLCFWLLNCQNCPAGTFQGLTGQSLCVVRNTSCLFTLLMCFYFTIGVYSFPAPIWLLIYITLLLDCWFALVVVFRRLFFFSSWLICPFILQYHLKVILFFNIARMLSFFKKKNLFLVSAYLQSCQYHLLFMFLLFCIWLGIANIFCFS